MRGLVNALLSVLIIGIFISLLPYAFDVTPQEYFFIGDESFSISDLAHSRWKIHYWNKQANSYVNVTNGIADLFYNETTGSDWGCSALIEGAMPHGWFSHLPILVGATKDKAENKLYCEFEKGKKLRGYILEAKVKFVSRNFEHEITDNTKSDVPKGNVGIDFMFAINDLNYYAPESERVCVHLDLYFASFRYENGEFKENNVGDFFIVDECGYDKDIHVGWVIGEWIDDGEWHIIRVDLGDIIYKLFGKLESYGISKLRCHVWQLYIEGIGVSVHAQFDYIKTIKV